MERSDIRGLPRVSLRSTRATNTEWFTQEARAFQAVAPRHFRSLGDADARPDRQHRLLGPRKKFERWLIESKSIMRSGHAERLAYASGARAQQTLLGESAPPAHGRKTLGRGKRPDQHGARRAFRLANKIQAPMDAVGTIDVGVSRRTEHDRVALSGAAEAVRGGIGVMIGLDLDDDAAHALE